MCVSDVSWCPVFQEYVLERSLLFYSKCSLSPLDLVFQNVESSTHLDEADIRGLLTEALTADVEAILADQTSLVSADAAIEIPVSL